jgi:hypothetical protein
LLQLIPRDAPDIRRFACALHEWNTPRLFSGIAQAENRELVSAVAIEYQL